MSISYDVFTGAFLSKVTERGFAEMRDYERNGVIDGYMARAIVGFKSICEYDFTTTADPIIRCFNVDVAEEDIDEIADIISEGMIAQWLKPYYYNHEQLQNVLNTSDFTTYSPAELLLRIGNAYKEAEQSYKQMIREYSFNHGDLSELHL